MDRLIHWAPRALGMAAIGFVSLFALDAFGPGVPLAEALAGFAVHLAPSALLCLVLAFAWRHELAGGAAFLVVSALPFVALDNAFVVNLMLAAPFAATGLLFVLSHLRRRRGSG